MEDQSQNPTFTLLARARLKGRNQQLEAGKEVSEGGEMGITGEEIIKASRKLEENFHGRRIKITTAATALAKVDLNVLGSLLKGLEHLTHLHLLLYFRKRGAVTARVTTVPEPSVPVHHSMEPEPNRSPTILVPISEPPISISYGLVPISELPVSVHHPPELELNRLLTVSIL